MSSMCAMPWISIHQMPGGGVLPCCIGNTEHKQLSNSINTLDQQVNSNFMNNLRLNMLAGKKHPVCESCYSAEDSGQTSFRQIINERYLNQFNPHNEVTTTGKLKHFKMRYFDMRFTNTCNFKCRTCNHEYSSQWEAETKQHQPEIIISTKSKQHLPELLNEIYAHIPHMQQAYFAGGEPLVSSEHYQILNEMIAQDRTDIELSYNTNISNLKFNGNDLIGIWKKWKGLVKVYASIDDILHRAEYIRHGTKWENIVENYRYLQTIPNIELSITTTISNISYLYLSELIQYICDNNLQPVGWDINPVFKPYYMSIQNLPTEVKQQARKKLEKVIPHANLPVHIKQQILNIPNVAESFNLWNDQKEKFLNETRRLDVIRTESFSDTFPELNSML